MLSDVLFKGMNASHRVLLKLSGGRFGNSFMDMPVLELTTTGRKSGQPRSTMLTAPLQQGDTLVLVASKGGDDRHPAWFLNLREHPEVEVSVQGGPRRMMHARVASSEERARLWPQVVADHDNYAGYQKRTTREIPLVLLDPVA